MSLIKTFLIGILLLLVPTSAFSEGFGYLRTSLVEGDVQIKTPEAGDWGFASINGPLTEGDEVWAPEESRVELQLNNGGYIRLGEGSAFHVLVLGQDSSQFYLSEGHAYVSYDLTRTGLLQIDTPDASTRAFDRSTFRVDISDQYTTVAVYEGFVETENELGKTRVIAGQMLSLRENTFGEVAPLGPPDEWDNWNQMRNERVSALQREDYHYLPPELRIYSYDLDHNGRWVLVPTFGYVWTPTAALGPHWCPYREGRWIWRGDDYIWVSFEPWGWAPYHYGRWSFVPTLGWCWVPPVAGDVYWAPGYVGWVRTANYVGWVPLAPGEIYYGRGHHGRHSVNTAQINQIRITNVYKNVYVNNGVTIVSRNTFATGSPRIVQVKPAFMRQELFSEKNLSPGPPRIQPTKESYFASPKRIPPSELPPQPIRDLQVKALRESRPLVKEPDKSVINRGQRTKDLPVRPVSTPRAPGKEQAIMPPPRPEVTGPTPKEAEPHFKPEERLSGRENVGPQEMKPYQSGKKAAVPEGVPGPAEQRPGIKADKGSFRQEDGHGLEDTRPRLEPEKGPAQPLGGQGPWEGRSLGESEKTRVAPEAVRMPQEQKPPFKMDKGSAGRQSGSASGEEKMQHRRENDPSRKEPEPIVNGNTNLGDHVTDSGKGRNKAIGSD